jgi:hypothetical protein
VRLDVHRYTHPLVGRSQSVSSHSLRQAETRQRAITKGRPLALMWHGIELTWKVRAQDELAFDAACLDSAVCVHDLVEA